MSQCLIIDDSAVIRKAIRRIMEKFEFDEIEEAENGQVALEKCREAMPDVVMLDWNMPVMDGLEYLIALRNEPDGDLPKVILCTTENEIDKIKEAMSEGANEYIMKPFNEDIIRDKLSMLGIIG